MREKNIKILTIVGARPQFIKAATVSRAIVHYNGEHSDHQISEILVHTGQHYDHNMSQVFFDELKINTPHYNLEIGSGTHGDMTGKMLCSIEEVLLEELPNVVLVYGDTNSTLAGALAYAKLHIPVAHIEAGLRSYNRRMPEEINRVLTDHVSIFLFCPTFTAVENLKKEGITHGVFQVGDVMYDAFLLCMEQATRKSLILEELNLKDKQYCLATVHRQENTDNPDFLKHIFDAFKEITWHDNPVIVPIHPRTKKMIGALGRKAPHSTNVRLISPLGYIDMIHLENNARVILTDSGGMQKEAYFAKVPCVTLREETEWVETVEGGVNILAGSDTNAIVDAYERALSIDMQSAGDIYGDGHAAEKIVDALISN